jgi:cytoskeletal protein CcmA (bactofilin family)
MLFDKQRDNYTKLNKSFDFDSDPLDFSQEDLKGETKTKTTTAGSSRLSIMDNDDSKNISESKQTAGSELDNTADYSQGIDIIDDLDKDNPEAILGQGITFRGDLTFQNYLCIEGRFEGRLDATQGKLKIGKTGEVKCDLTLKAAVIEGRVEGDIVASQLLELRGNAVIHGNIRARNLRVDDGVTIIGHVCIDPKADPEKTLHPHTSLVDQEMTNTSDTPNE